MNRLGGDSRSLTNLWGVCDPKVKTGAGKATTTPLEAVWVYWCKRPFKTMCRFNGDELTLTITLFCDDISIIVSDEHHIDICYCEDVIQQFARDSRQHGTTVEEFALGLKELWSHLGIEVTGIAPSHGSIRVRL